MDLFEAMQAFVRVAERSSFTGAAKDLRTSQPHVTRAVQQLEARTGSQLFTRTTRRLALTDVGRAYLDRCRAILEAVEDADDSVGGRAGTLRGELRVFAPVSLGRAWIVPRLSEFLARHLELSIHLLLDDRPRDLVEERVDVAVRVGPLASSTQRVRKLGEVERLLVGAPSYWKKRRRPRTPAELEGEAWLIFDGTVRVDQARCVRADVEVEVGFTGRFSTNSSEAIQEALRLGQGLCLAPYWLVAADLAAGRLERVLPEWRTPPALPIYAAYPETRAPTEKVRRFVDWLAESFEGDGLFARGP
jgi:DNA-binding transcriptional LysR family regulator